MSFTDLQKNVISAGLCTSCGTCVSICPVSCIKMTENYVPMLFKECNDCGQCVKFCPVIDCDLNKLQKTVFHNAQCNPLIGTYRNLYFGRAIDQKLRLRSSGGGIASALIISALERKLADKAVVVRMDNERIGRTKVLVAKSRDDVLRAAESKYVSAPVNLILKEISSIGGAYCFVGLPCHVHALRKLQADGMSVYSQRVKIVIGLFCGSALSDNFLDFIFSMLNAKRDWVREISFRHRRNLSTSSLRIETVDGKELLLDREDYSFLFYLFAKQCCLYCVDHTNELADISIGDMRPFPQDSPNFKIIEPLQSVIIVRTKKGAELLQRTKSIEYSDYSIQDLIATKLTNIVDKKICTHTRLILRRKMGMPIPEFNQGLTQDSFLKSYRLQINPSNALELKRYVYELFWIVLIRLNQKRYFSRLLSIFPLHFWKAVIRHGYLRFKLTGIVHKQARD